MSFRPSEASGEILNTDIMKRIFIAILAATTLLAGCEEFQPVFTGTYPDPEQQYIYTDEDFLGTDVIQFMEISELKAMYGGKPTKVDQKWVAVWPDGDSDPKNDITYQQKYGDRCIIKGQVTTSDQVGNLYKSLYIQDGTAGIEVKIGRNGLYNEYKLGQWIYVDCSDLTVGDYNGMINLGYADPTNEYETSYIEHPYLVDTHVFKGEYADPVQPVEVSESELLLDVNLGRLVTIKGLKYGYTDNYGLNQIFILAYVDPNGDRKDYTNNCIFVDEDWKQPTDRNLWVDTWACSEIKWKEYLYSGIFDGVDVAGVTVGTKYEHFMSVNISAIQLVPELVEYVSSLPAVYVEAINSGKIDMALYGEITDSYPEFARKFKNYLEEKEVGYKETRDNGEVYYHIGSMAYSVSQYFTMGSKGVQVRSSGYARFADTKIPAEVLDGKETVTLTGILTKYKGEAQFTLIDLDGVKKADGSNWY